MSNLPDASTDAWPELEDVRDGPVLPLRKRELDPLATVDERTRRLITHRRAARVGAGRGWLMRRALLLADVLGLAVAFVIAELVTNGGVASLLPNAETAAFLVSLPVWVVVAKLYGLYDRDEERTDHSTADDMVGVFHVVTVGTWLLLMGSWITGLAQPKLIKLVLFWALAVVTIATARAIARGVCRHHIRYLQNTVIVGAGEVGQLVAKKVLQHPEYGLNLVGFLDDRPRERRVDLEDLALLGGVDRLTEVIDELNVERVVIAFSNDSNDRILDQIRELSRRQVQIDIVPRFFDVVGPGLGMHTIEGLPLIGLPPLRLSRSSRLLKRLMDALVAVVALLVLALPFAIVAILIKLDSAGPVFFKQTRMGAEGTFWIWKFRTMAVDADARKPAYAHLNKHACEGGDPRMFKIPNDPRVTHVGRWLRRYSLDEFPQLVNVLRGQMSLVGPRPLILDEDRHVENWGRRRLELKPGMTGLWQVTGRNDIPFEEMVKLDYVYVTGWSLFGDVRLMLKTIPILLRPSAA